MNQRLLLGNQLIHWILLGICCLGMLPLQAQLPLSLEEAVEQGMQNNYAVQIAAQNRIIAQNNNSWGRAGRYPTANAFLNINNSFTNLNNPASFLIELNQLQNGVNPGLEANWNVYDGNRVKLTKSQLEDQQTLSDKEWEIARQDVKQSVMLAYYQVLIQAEQLQVVKKVLQLSKDRLDFEKARAEYGQSGTFDLLQSQDAFLNDSTNFLLQLNNFENAQRQLNLAMGKDALDQRYQLTTTLEFDPPLYNLEELRNRALSSNPNLQALFVSREVAEINTRLEESERLPNIALNAGAVYNYNIANGEGTFADGNSLDLTNITSEQLNYSLGVSATYNLLNGGNRKRDIENSQLQEVIAQMNVDDFKRQLDAQLRTALANYNTRMQSVRLTDALLDNAAKNLEIAEERFKGGLINSFDYRSIQVAYLNASQARLDALFNLKTTELELLRLIGGL